MGESEENGRREEMEILNGIIYKAIKEFKKACAGLQISIVKSLSALMASSETDKASRKQSCLPFIIWKHE